MAVKPHPRLPCPSWVWRHQALLLAHPCLCNQQSDVMSPVGWPSWAFISVMKFQHSTLRSFFFFFYFSCNLGSGPVSWFFFWPFWCLTNNSYFCLTVTGFRGIHFLSPRTDKHVQLSADPCKWPVSRGEELKSFFPPLSSDFHQFESQCYSYVVK